MKPNKQALHQQRHQLDRRIHGWRGFIHTPAPRSGWLKAVREALGLTTRQLGALQDIDAAGISRLEKRELEGTATLESLSRAAAAMGCKLVYAIVPDESLEKTLDERVRITVKALLGKVSHSMKLEDQEISKKAQEEQAKELGQKLKATLDPLLWKKDL